MAGVGLALSGGGIAGCAHIGVLCALEEAGIRVDALAGTSSGAMIAALYAYGYSAAELVELVPAVSKDLLDYNYWAWVAGLFSGRRRPNGVIKGERLRAFIAGKTGHARMSELRLPLAITATDLCTARPTLFVSAPIAGSESGSGSFDTDADIPVADAVLSSMAIPVLFRPVYWKGKVLVDGGLIDNCPVEAVRTLGVDQVIAVNLVSAEQRRSASFPSLRSVLSRVVTINLSRLADRNTTAADLVLTPGVGSVGVLDFSMLQACVERGYEHTRRRIRDIQELVLRSEEQASRALSSDDEPAGELLRPSPVLLN